MLKKCSKCQTDKPLEAFTKRAGAKDGYRAQCRVCRHKPYYEANKQAILARNKARQTSETRLINAARAKQWRKENPERNLFLNRVKRAKRRALQKLATPKWLTEADWKVITSIYANCPKNYEVDHVVPLTNKIVTGLHVPWNLAYLTKEANRIKSNRLEF